MAKALWQTSTEEADKGRKPIDWKKRISDHVAFALLAYTGLQIYVTMGALRSEHGSILPYFALVLLVVAIIPGLRLLERRWERLADSGARREQLTALYRRDLVTLWVAAIGLPFVVTGIVKLALSVV
jgi:hypothetical protein